VQPRDRLRRISRLRPASLPLPRGAPGSGRDARIDLLRGLCVVAMVIDHLAGPSYLYAITGGNRFYTSAAEGFILISGLVMGLAYRRLVARDGLGLALRRALERAVTLYLVTVTLTLLFIPASELLGMHWAEGEAFPDPLTFVVSILTLHRTYYLVDIPLLYTLLLMAAPIVLVLLSQGRTAVVLMGSWLLWLAYQLYPEQTSVPWPIAGNHLFFLSAWQIFFFTGMVLGWHREQIAARLACIPRRPVLVVLGLLSAALIAAYRIQDSLLSLWSDAPQRASDIQLFLIEAVFSKSDVRPGRLLATAIVFGFLYLLVTELWGPIRRLAGWLLLPLGERALYAYAAHILLAVPIALLLDRLPLASAYPRLVSAALQAAAILVIWLLARHGLLVVGEAPGVRRYAWPASAAAACLLLLPLAPQTPTANLASAAPDSREARVARAFGTPTPRKAPATDPAAPDSAGPNGSEGARYLAGELLHGQIAGTLESEQFFSSALYANMSYFIYLPPGYDDDERRYPTLYMLHGNSGSNEEWLAYGLVDLADEMIVTGEIEPMIIVLPEGGLSSYWVNWPDDGPRFADYLNVDLVRHIGSTYRVLPGARNKALGGLSMGGTGALVNAFRHPNIWGAVGAHSPALPQEGERDMLGEGADFRDRDPVSLALNTTGLTRLAVWMDIGDDDDWLPRAEQLNDALEARHIGHTYAVTPGEHDGDYWASHIPDYLRFYDGAFHAPQP
jgi:enterochelin esterase-like enzyme